ncbi:hypothetical protein ZWY2020_020564 [Hordeum vulgare]|nr:hypothetical protein ZWY2020_020564 [Hordeum vulgare]
MAGSSSSSRRRRWRRRGRGVADGAVTYFHLLFYIAISGGQIFFNKASPLILLARRPGPATRDPASRGNGVILKRDQLPYPVALTLLHMVIKIDEGMTTDGEYVSSVIPIGAMCAMTLWLGNSAYLYISVAFAQMLKAIMPVAVFLLGTAFGLEEMNCKMLGIMSVISVGVIVASVGEITISWVGVVYQMVDAFCLFIPWLFLEKPKMDASISWNFPPVTLFLNCMCTFVLNLSVFLVISRTSALTARVTGVVRIGVVLLSAAIFADTKLTFINIVGYAIVLPGGLAAAAASARFGCRHHCRRPRIPWDPRRSPGSLLSTRVMDSSEIPPSDRREELPAASLPAAFLEFLGENGLDPTLYSKADAIPRYIRLKPGTESRVVAEIECELKCDLRKVSWLPDFYAIPPEIQIAGSKAYQQGKIYGIDAASGAAILALDVQPGDHVLDLCAAPGAKLCMLADMLGSTGSLTGVDVAKHRLAACRTMLQKYSLGDRAKAADSPHPSSNSQPELIYNCKDSGLVGLQNVMSFAHNQCCCLYIWVLVDAECTHDGSIKHIQKFEFWGWKTLDRRVLNVERTGNLLHLQLGLLTNGFKLLKTGGSLVYSTCSLTVAQNENVVQQFLSKHPSAELLKIDPAGSWPCRSGGIQKTLRFDPATSQTSGLFVAKFVKL